MTKSRVDHGNGVKTVELQVKIFFFVVKERVLPRPQGLHMKFLCPSLPLLRRRETETNILPNGRGTNILPNGKYIRGVRKVKESRRHCQVFTGNITGFIKIGDIVY